TAPTVRPAPDPTGGQQTQPGRGTGTAAEQPTRVELRNLSSGAVKSWQDMQGFLFSPNSTHLILKRRPPTPAGAGRGNAAGGDQTPAPGGGAGAGGGTANAPAGPRGTDVILHNLTTGRDQLLGRVGDI